MEILRRRTLGRCMEVLGWKRRFLSVRSPGERCCRRGCRPRPRRRTWRLTPQGLPAEGSCLLLLAPGDCAELEGLRAERVVTYGLSPRDSLTLSSLAEPVLCVQRALPRPDGTVIEPQEFPLPDLPAPAEELLPLLGLRLLQMPLETAFRL